MHLILREFNGYQIRQREDGYFNLTDMSKASGKRYYDWIRLDSTNELISVLSHKSGISRETLITSKKGVGTYGHKKVAIAFATWCSPEFFSVVIDWADSIMTDGYVIADHSAETIERLEAELSQIKAIMFASTIDVFLDNMNAYFKSQDVPVMTLKLQKDFKKSLKKYGIFCYKDKDVYHGRPGQNRHEWLPRYFEEWLRKEFPYFPDDFPTADAVKRLFKTETMKTAEELYPTFFN